MANTSASYDKTVDKVVNSLFKMKREMIIVLLIFLLALIIRSIAAVNLGVNADDMHFSVHAINFLNSGKLVTYDQSASLWYYLTDVFYHVFGTTQFASRFSAVLFGSLSVILLFLITKRYFGTKAGIFSALLLALSNFHIRNTLSEMDNTAMFFVFLGLYVSILAKDKNKSIYLVFAGVFLGLGILTKVYSLLFIPVYVLNYLYLTRRNNEKVMNKKIFYDIFTILVFAFLFCLPSLTHNYLLYKDQGFTDFIYANTLHVGGEKAEQYYSWDAGWGHETDWKGWLLGDSPNLGGDSPPTSLMALNFVLRPDMLIFVLGVIGLLILIFKEKDKSYLSIFLLVFIFAFCYMSATILLPKHYVFLLFILIPPAGLCLEKITDYLARRNIKVKYVIGIVVLIMVYYLTLGYNIGMVGQVFSKSAVEQVMEYKDANIPPAALVVADSRIYTGRTHWMLNSRYYIDAAQWNQLMAYSSQVGGQQISVPVYYIECALDDCGWGTVRDSPSLNASMEAFTAQFKSTSTLVDTIDTPEFNSQYIPFIDSKRTEMNIYKTTVTLSPSALVATKGFKTWFLYPIGYDESVAPIFDKYTVHNPADKLLNYLAFFVVYLAILLAFFSVFAIFYLLAKQDE